MNKPINQSGWKPGTPVASDGSAHPTVTGNKALMLEEPLIFESGGSDTCGGKAGRGGKRSRSSGSCKGGGPDEITRAVESVILGGFC